MSAPVPDLSKPTKAAMREFAKRCREDLRDMERCVRQGRWDVAVMYARQAAGNAGEAQNVVEEMRAKAGTS